MKPVMQNKFGKGGNYLSACFASLFEKDLSAVRYFFDNIPEDVEQDDPKWVPVFWNNVHEYLRSQGYGMIHLCNDHIEETIGMMEGYFLVGGQSPRGYSHSVIYTKDGLAHDPHPEGGGVIPETVSVIYPLFNKEQLRTYITLSPDLINKFVLVDEDKNWYCRVLEYDLETQKVKLILVSESTRPHYYTVDYKRLTLCEHQY